MLDKARVFLGLVALVCGVAAAVAFELLGLTAPNPPCECTMCVTVDAGPDVVDASDAGAGGSDGE